MKKEENELNDEQYHKEMEGIMVDIEAIIKEKIEDFNSQERDNE